MSRDYCPYCEDTQARLRSVLTEDQRWIASLITHMEDNWRAIDEGPIQRARDYLMQRIAADKGTVSR